LQKWDAADGYFYLVVDDTLEFEFIKVYKISISVSILLFAI